MRRFEFVDDTSSKFWEIDFAEGASEVIVTYGRIGSSGQTQTKTFASTELAAKEADKLVREKVGKGYDEVEQSATEDRSTDAPFAGRHVGDFPRTVPGPGIAVRLHIGWESDDEITFEDLVAKLARHAKAAQLEALVIGGWIADSLDTPDEALEPLVDHAGAFPELRALFFGDVSQEASEISWVEQGDQARLANAFPKLEVLHIRGAGNGELEGLNLPSLHTLILETGGLHPDAVRAVLRADLPALRHLELWLGTPSYGGDTQVADLEPLFNGTVHRSLTYLGLRNSELADDVAIAIAQAPILEWIEELDLSLGTIGNLGYAALREMRPSPKLRRLNVSHHYADSDHVNALLTAMQARNVEVDTSDEQDLEDEERWVSISE